MPRSTAICSAAISSARVLRACRPCSRCRFPSGDVSPPEARSFGCRPYSFIIRPMKNSPPDCRAFFASLAGLTAACERRPPRLQSTTGDILVGMYGSLTGDGASFGQSSREGTELAVEEINAAGGLLGGRKIRLLVEDDQSKPEEASNAVTKLDHAGQGRRRARRGGQPPHAGRRARRPEVPDPDDHALLDQRAGDRRSATTSSASASSIRSRAKCSRSSPTTI